MSPLFFVVNTVLGLSVYLFIIRLWMQYTGVNFYNPLAQFVVKISQPIIGPLRKFIPSLGRFDTATFIVLFCVAALKLCATLYFTKFNIYLGYKYWQCFIYAPLVIIHSFGYLIFWLLFIRAILSWVSHGQSQLEVVLYQLTEPLITPIRRVIPPIGNIDISFMIFLFGLTFLNIVFSNLFGFWWEILSI